MSWLYSLKCNCGRYCGMVYLKDHTGKGFCIQYCNFCNKFSNGTEFPFESFSESSLSNKPEYKITEKIKKWITSLF